MKKEQDLIGFISLQTRWPRWVVQEILAGLILGMQGTLQSKNAIDLNGLGMFRSNGRNISFRPSRSLKRLLKNNQVSHAIESLPQV